MGSAPAAYSQTQRFGSKTARRESKTEFVGGVNGQADFTVSSYFINPGLATTFPWLSKVAVNYQQYHFLKLRFRYVTRSSTQAIGTVILVPEYNPSDPPPESRSVACNAQDAVSEVPWAPLHCDLDPKAMFPLGPRKQIRTGTQSGDLSVYDAGVFRVCTVGQAAAAEVGELWVDYTIDLFVPQTSLATTVATYTSIYVPTGAAPGQVFNDGTNTLYLMSLQGNDGATFGATDGLGYWTPAKGTYLIRLIANLQMSALAATWTGLTQFLVNANPLAYPAISYSYITPNGAVPGQNYVTVVLEAVITFITGQLFSINGFYENVGVASTTVAALGGTRLVIQTA